MFISRLVKRVPLPHIEGAWIDVQQPTFAEKLRALQAAETDGEQAVAIITASIVAWSAPEPVTPEQIALLDDDSWKALFEAMTPAAAATPDIEGNADGRSEP